MPNRVQLQAQRREIVGKKVNRLRREGLLPATVYGHRIEPVSIQLDAHAFRDAIHRAGITQLIDLVIDSEVARPVLIKQMSRDVRKNAVTHVEFFQANLSEPVSTHLPLHFTGDSPAVQEGGIFLPVLTHVDIQSLPQNVPAGGIEVDISSITEINGSIHAGDMKLPDGVTLVTPPDEVVAKVNPPTREEVVQESIEATEPLPTELGGNQTPPDAIPEA